MTVPPRTVFTRTVVSDYTEENRQGKYTRKEKTDRTTSALPWRVQVIQ